MSLKLTSAERLRIKAWLEKDPKSEDKNGAIDLTRDDGTFIRLRRTTQYYGDSWKVRTAYEVESNFPVCHSSPLPYGSNIKTKTGPKWVMTPKFDPPAESKAVGNPGAFAKAMEKEMANMKSQMKQYLATPSPMWDFLTKVEPAASAAPDSYVTFKVNVSDDHKKHLDLHMKAKKGVLKDVRPEGDPS